MFVRFHVGHHRSALVVSLLLLLLSILRFVGADRSSGSRILQSLIIGQERPQRRDLATVDGVARPTTPNEEENVDDEEEEVQTAVPSRTRVKKFISSNSLFRSSYGNVVFVTSLTGFNLAIDAEGVVYGTHSDADPRGKPLSIALLKHISQRFVGV